MYLRIISFSLIFFLSKTVTGQFKKGMLMPGITIGSIEFNTGSGDISFPAPTTGFTSKNTSFGAAISPSLGWFINDKTVIGLLLNINPRMDKTTYEGISGNTFQKDKVNTFNIALGGFIRNYFSSSSSHLPYAQFGINGGISTRKSEGFYIDPAYKETYNGKSSGGFFTNASLQTGITKMLNSNTGLDFFAGYNFSYSKNTFATTTLRDIGNNGSIESTSFNTPTTKFTNHGFMIGAGFRVFLDRKKK